MIVSLEENILAHDAFVNARDTFLKTRKVTDENHYGMWNEFTRKERVKMLASPRGGVSELEFACEEDYVMFMLRWAA